MAESFIVGINMIWSRLCHIYEPVKTVIWMHVCSPCCRVISLKWNLIGNSCPSQCVARAKRLLYWWYRLIHKVTRNIFKKDIRRLSNTYNFNTTKWRNPLILPVFACWKRMFRLKPANLEVVLCFWSLFCLVLFSLSDMHLNRSKF